MSQAKPFHFLLSEYEAGLLRACAERLGVSQGHVVRCAIRRVSQMVCEGKPKCANGHHCFVPHMWEGEEYGMVIPPEQSVLPGVKPE